MWTAWVDAGPGAHTARSGDTVSVHGDMSGRAGRCDYTEPLPAGEPVIHIEPRLLHADSVTLWTTEVTWLIR